MATKTFHTDDRKEIILWKLWFCDHPSRMVSETSKHQKKIIFLMLLCKFDLRRFKKQIKLFLGVNPNFKYWFSYPWALLGVQVKHCPEKSLKLHFFFFCLKSGIYFVFYLYYLLIFNPKCNMIRNGRGYYFTKLETVYPLI